MATAHIAKLSHAVCRKHSPALLAPELSHPPKPLQPVSQTSRRPHNFPSTPQSGKPTTARWQNNTAAAKNKHDAGSRLGRMQQCRHHALPRTCTCMESGGCPRSTPRHRPHRPPRCIRGPVQAAEERLDPAWRASSAAGRRSWWKWKPRC